MPISEGEEEGEIKKWKKNTKSKKRQKKREVGARTDGTMVDLKLTISINYPIESKWS